MAPDSGRDSGGPVSGLRRKILVVDDSELILKLTAGMLRSAGFDVTTCDNPVGVAMRVIAEKPDLVLVDLDLGNVSGDRVIASLKNGPRTAHVRACLYTASDDPSVAAAVKRSRADGVIPKGSDAAALARAVRKAMA